MSQRVMIGSFLVVLLPTLLMCYIVHEGYFSTAKVELGTQHYAERIHPSWKQSLPRWMKMPINTIVNIGYVIVGAAWCAVASIGLSQGTLTVTDAVLFYCFNYASCCYGGLQALRILTQLHGFAVLDQWYTLPFFMCVFVWGLYLRYGWSSVRASCLMVTSISSYCLVLLNDRGFEACLGVHITLALLGGLIGWGRHPQAKARYPLVAALICCSGFIGLKLLDLHLPKYHDVFRYVSGHFISKICDIFQIYYVNRFFLALTVAKSYDSKKKKE